MALLKVLAVVPVADFDAAISWYERLFPARTHVTTVGNLDALWALPDADAATRWT